MLSLKNVDTGFPAGPSVDEQSMRYYGLDGVQARVPAVVFESLRNLRREPKCDINAQMIRLKVMTPVMQGPSGKDYSISLLSHGVIAGLVVGLPTLLNWQPSRPRDLVPIEVSFGIGDLPVNAPRSLNRNADAPPDPSTNPTTPSQEPAPPPQALKAPEQLPQLPKNVAVEAPPPQKDSMELPDTPAAKKPTPTPTPVARVTVTPAPGVKTLTPEELLRRAERERRQVGEKEQEGVHRDSSPSSIPKDPTSSLPPNPFDGGIPDAPPGLAPAGDPSGTMTPTARSAYQAAAANHMRQRWKIPEFLTFSSELEVQVGIRVNTFGRVIGGPTLEKSSGNREFDDVALEAVKDAAPFPDLPSNMSFQDVILNMRAKEARK